MTLTNLSIAGNGEVTANVAAACNATTSTFSLRVTDSGNLSATATLTVNITANQPPTLSYPANPGAVYGTGLTINPLTGPSDDVGVNSVSVQNITPTNPGGITVNSTGFVTVATTVPPGMYTVTIRAAASCGNTDANFTLGIVKATPVVTWNNPADIVYGTALSGTQLNTTANIPGSFIYTPAAGTVLNAGNGQMLSVSFSPTDASNYNAASRMVTINVLKATPVVTWNNPADITYGTAVSATQLNATADVAGSFAYTPASGSVLNAGNAQSLAVTFTPTDTTNYRSTTKGVAINVLKATPAITWSNPADIIYGTAVSATQLNATANVAGAFTYTPPGGTVPSAGNGQSLSVNFTPTDTANYNSASKSATINVLKATSTVTWSNPADIIYGTALSAAQLNATANTAGTFSYTPAAGTVLNAGAGQSLAVNFTPTDSANYNPAAKSVTINVLKATPSISWGNPADIVYSTALSATQLNATANVTGTFNYTPGVNTILNAGNGQTLSVTFTPTNPTNYNPTTKVVQLNILKAPLTVNVNNAFRNQGDANPPFSGNVTGLLNGDVITASYGTTATTASAPGPYPITATLTDPGNRLNNYQVTNTPGTLTILNSCGIVISPATFLPASLALPYAQPLSASPSGTYSFSLFAGSLPPGLQIVNNSGYYTLQGTPTVPGTYTFTVRTQRSGSTCEAIRTYTLTIAPTVVPKVTCKTANPNGSYTVQFGYENTTGAAVTLPVGANNTFTSGAADRGQTTVFQVGIVNNAFSVTFANAGAFTGWAVKGPDGALRSVTPSVLLPNCP